MLIDSFAMIFISALFAYWLDALFGEYPWIRHPVILMGDSIAWFEKRFYQDSLLAGSFLALFVIGLATDIGLIFQLAFSQLPMVWEIALTAFIASMLFAHHMLYHSVKVVAESDTPKDAIKYLVSRDCENLSDSDAHKAAIETYAENLSDGVIAPLFYFLLLGLPGLFAYKAINTLDSMVGYRTQRYEKFGKTSAKIDDLANWIPARLTAVLILLIHRVSFSKWPNIFTQASAHASPNAGFPITAMAFSTQVKLGGPTVYFGKLKQKPYFGEQQTSSQIKPSHVFAALKTRVLIDHLISIFLLLSLLVFAVL